ncbi:MAG TPA: cupin domain-containing protein, partial [Alphaproteobacteria bacterium]|nr:cupin domain-containing protein [Alphaproteobacteria bacterium]
MQSAADLIAALGMKPHPEGGHYAESWRSADGPAGRGHASLIYFLLQAGEFSHWHRVDAEEIWLWHAGAPLALSMSADGRDSGVHTLGPDLSLG